VKLRNDVWRVAAGMHTGRSEIYSLRRHPSVNLLCCFDRRFGRCATRHSFALQQVRSKHDRSTIDGDVGNL
jgi:hypothetical protein